MLQDSFGLPPPKTLRALALMEASQTRTLTKQVDSFFSEVAETNRRRSPRR